MNRLPSLALCLAGLALCCRSPAADAAENGPRDSAEVPLPPVTDDLVVYEPGNMPLILLVPHDGTVKPDGMPVLSRLIGRDVGTAPLARLLVEQLRGVDRDGVQRKPYLVINRLHRSLMEPNRSWRENLHRGWQDRDGRPLPPHPRAERVHRDFHACADHAVQRVQAEHGSGLLLDLHGLASTRTPDVYGYLLPASDYAGTGGDADLARAIRERSSMRHAASRKQSDEEVAGLLRGASSLATLVSQAWNLSENTAAAPDPASGPRPATPSSQYPDPKGPNTPDREKTYFNGAYDVFAHSSRQAGIRVDAIQIELTADARNTDAGRRRYAACLSLALRRFLALHYGLDIQPPEAP